MSNLALWDSLCETDPKYTKEFKRPGGFKGTAQNPTYVIRKLTDKLGPVGKGWGFDEPKFTFKDSPEGECLVFCTLKAWHGTPDQIVYGVGGDVCIKKTDYGMRIDDEAQKKAFTDAFTNAFKFIGVGADLHLGMFDDSKYVNELKAKLSDDKPHIMPKNTVTHDKNWKSVQMAICNDMEMCKSMTELDALMERADKDIQAMPDDFASFISDKYDGLKSGGFPDKPKVKFASVKDALNGWERMNQKILTFTTLPELRDWVITITPYLDELDRVLTAKMYLNDKGQTPRQELEANVEFHTKTILATQG